MKRNKLKGQQSPEGAASASVPAAQPIKQRLLSLLALAGLCAAAFGATYASALWSRRPQAHADWPPGMRWILAGEFTMGTDDPNSMANERPAHRVRLDGFWLDEHDVTNAEFRRFVEAPSYVTTAERKPDW